VIIDRDYLAERVKIYERMISEQDTMFISQDKFKEHLLSTLEDRNTKLKLQQEDNRLLADAVKKEKKKKLPAFLKGVAVGALMCILIL
jgi:hypothetical protein